MQIRLNHIQFTEIDYKVKTFDKEITHQLETSLSVGSSFPNDTENGFVIIFNIALQSRSKKFKLKLKAVAHFLTPDLIDDNFKNSPFIEVNAPAIAFPYVRSFISNLTLNSGFDPIILPSFNFVQLAEEARNK
jgi:preprotein translocase subunit SecB